MDKPCLVETIQAAAGIDIGDTLIGMIRVSKDTN
jgi:uncharacterized protein YwlG (UPF0340 family)